HGALSDEGERVPAHGQPGVVEQPCLLSGSVLAHGRRVHGVALVSLRHARRVAGVSGGEGHGRLPRCGVSALVQLLARRLAGGASRANLRDWWNPRAEAYFDAMRTAFAATSGHPRYLVIPNTDALVDGTDEPAFLAGTDGVFTENWQTILASAGDEGLSLRR